MCNGHMFVYTIHVFLRRRKTSSKHSSAEAQQQVRNSQKSAVESLYIVHLVASWLLRSSTCCKGSVVGACIIAIFFVLLDIYKQLLLSHLNITNYHRRRHFRFLCSAFIVCVCVRVCVITHSHSFICVS